MYEQKEKINTNEKAVCMTFFHVNKTVPGVIWQPRVCWPLLCICCPFCIFERCLDSNSESCRSKQKRYHLAVLRIHDILGWIRIRIRGSMPLTNGSGSGFGSGYGSWIRILLFSSLTFKIQQKTSFFHTIFSAYYFLKLHLHHFLKIKSQKESQNSRNQGFSYYFWMMIEGSGSRAGSGSGSIHLTSGSGSGRPKNCEKHVDPVDPDPQHCHLATHLPRCDMQQSIY
jgi:hypothetical protein